MISLPNEEHTQHKIYEHNLPNMLYSKTHYSKLDTENEIVIITHCLTNHISKHFKLLINKFFYGRQKRLAAEFLLME